MRTVPTLLQADLDSGETTTTFLMRIDPVTPGYDSVGITLLDHDVAYDDGNGSVNYVAAIGMIPSNLSTTSEMDVGNAEFQHLIPDAEFDLPITEEALGAGVYDFSWYTVYLINYEAPDHGHVVISYGQLGQMRMQDGMTFWTEFTELTKLLMQSLVEKDSITCRATFGSQPFGTVDADIVERFPCGKTYTWVSGTVTSIGVETTREFVATGLIGGAYEPGMVKWVTGPNAGRQSEVEAFDPATGTTDLAFETMFPMTSGDTFQIRTDCTKAVEGSLGCKDHWGIPEWKLHYRGEPFIPISDADQLNTPGATVSAGMGG